MTDLLKGKIAIVTGGAQGIGQAIVQCLCEAGATVVAGDLKRPSDSTILWAELDVADEDSIAAFVRQMEETQGGVDILVNNAGIMFEKSLDQQTSSDWDHIMAVNLRGPFLMAKHTAPSMKSRGGGAIVNIGSIEGYACNPNHTAYAASKGGVHTLSVALAVDLGPYGIRSNAVAPGWIDTELNKAYLDSQADRGLAVAELSKLHPVGHIGEPKDVGDVVVWLASDMARFVTGQVITIDGGRTKKLPLPAIFGR